MKVAMKEASKTTGHKPAAYYVHQSVAPEIILDTPRLLPLRTHTNNSFPKNKRATKTLRYGGFGCTIRSVPLRWLTIGFRAFDKLFYNRNSLRSYVYVRSHGNKENVLLTVFRQHEAKSEPFRMRFASLSRSISRIQYKKREIGGQIGVNLGICQHF